MPGAPAPAVLIVFCCDPLAPRRPDADYAAEWDAAILAGFQTALIEVEPLLNDGDAHAAAWRLAPRPRPVAALYRGWMLPSPLYGALADALAAKNIVLLTDVEAYALTHELPRWYALLADQTPRTVWLPWSGALDLAAVERLLEPFGDRPLILKDYVKSRKHEWLEACFIPSASDAAAVERVVRRFLELQGTGLNGGLVFREFVAFTAIGHHARSGMPLTEEYRLFFFDGVPIDALPYWEQQAPDSVGLPLEQMRAAAARIDSRFFTIDVARRSDGSLMIVELGDAQVAGLPAQTDVAAFYRALAAAVGKAPTGGG